MKPWLLFFFLPALLLVSCSKDTGSGIPQSTGGIEVGTGRRPDHGQRLFVSAHGYQFRYDSRLTLAENSSGREVELRNSAFVPHGSPHSSVKIEVRYGEDDPYRDETSVPKKLELLKAATLAAHEGQIISDATFPGATGYRAENTAIRFRERGRPEIRDDTYYLITEQGRYVVLRVKEYRFFSGIKLLAPVVDSLRFQF